MVTVPLWLLVLVVVLAVIAFLDRLLMPSVRWALQRRANRAIDELNTRLKLRIQPFKLTRKRVLVDRLVHDPEVAAAIAQHAEETGEPVDVAAQRAEEYAREIVPSFSPMAYFGLGTRMARWLSRALYRVRIGYTNEDSLRNVDPDSAVVFVINHRSNMDYVLVTYLAASSSALSYAVGEWAQMWLLRGLIKSMGAYFIRRDSRNALYRKVLSRYVAMATEGGVTQAVFPEGGLSRDGALRPPKFGLVSYMVSNFDPNGPRDVVFIPVGLNYDRVLEDRVLTARLDEETDGHRFAFNLFVVLRFLAKSLILKLRSRWFKYGYACVSFGHAVSLREYLAERGQDFRLLQGDAQRKAISDLSHHLMDAVGHVVPVLPVSLVATVLLEDPSHEYAPFELKARVFEVMRQIEQAGGFVHVPRADREYAVEVGIRMLALRKLVHIHGDHVRANPDEEVILRYYANAIVHLLTKHNVAVPKPVTTRQAAV